jgi:hypothetical protein
MPYTFSSVAAHVWVPGVKIHTGPIAKKFDFS